MAHIVVVTLGTRGDVVPFLALGSALRDAGHRFTIATHGSLRTHVEGAGLGFAALPVEFGTSGPLTSTELARVLAGHWLEVGRAVAAASKDADLLLLGASGWIGYHVAQARGVPSMGAFLQPLEPTRAFPPALLTTRSLGGWGNLTAARAFRLLGQAPFARQTAALRRELGLPPRSPAATFRQMDAERWPVLHGFSPAVVPPPADWPAYRPVTGYWWPPPGGELSPRLQRFLDDGEPPVFVGFGSMTGHQLSDLIHRTGCRAVVQGSAGPDRAGPDRAGADSRNVLAVGDEPHAALFPRVAVAVHHAGAGTTAAALRAGVPAVCVPFTADQPFWAHRVAALGAGPPPLRRRGLTWQRLAGAIEAARGCRPGAAAIAAKLAAEDGVGRAVAEITRRLPVA
ncbi:glycosyltransferase [Actinoplanes sp. NBC_00393]|uniref:glycosyltransferase n=1 Tax=Actinoplanes sp. NBC_00393 TaxID=2975953 RepID=UPI002E22B8A9